MRNLLSRPAAGALIVAALGLAGCGDRAAAPASSNNSMSMNSSEVSPMGNDASAMESIANEPAAPAPLPTTSSSGNSAAPTSEGNSASSSESSPPSSGSTVESNISGM